MDKRILVVCYSFSNGNTKQIAQELQKQLDADYAQIETVIPYPPYEGSDSEVVSQGQKEVNESYQPEIKDLNVNIDDYDIIAIGTPTWWYTMAPAVLTFLSTNNFDNKTVIPFMTHGGWPGHVIDDIKKCCGQAIFLDDMQIQFDSDGGNKMITSQSDIENWINRLKKEIL